MKYHKPYVNKNLVKFSYKELKSITRTNRQLYYEMKKANIKPEKNTYIKIGHLNDDYSTKVSRTQTKINYMRYARMTTPENINKAQLAKKAKYELAKTNLMNKILASLNKEGFRPDTVEAIKLGMKDLTMGKIGDYDIYKNALFRENLQQAIFNNFEGVISDGKLNDILSRIMELNIVQLHQLSQDDYIKNLIDFIYYDLQAVGDRVKETIETINRYSGNLEKL